MNERNKNLMYFAVSFCAVAFAILALVVSFVQLKSGNRNIAGAVIAVNGEGYVMASPDVAIVRMTARFEAKKTADAAKVVKEKVAKITELLTSKFKVEKKDIKTENYSTYPKYIYSQTACSNNYCPPSQPVLTGYEVSQNITIKIRKLDEVDNVVEALNSTNVNELNSFSFEVEDDNKFKDEARKIAINKAKNKAEILAKQLGVKLVRITSFSESNYEHPRSYAMKAMTMEANSVASDAPAITSGENKVTSNVSLTFEIK